MPLGDIIQGSMGPQLTSEDLGMLRMSVQGPLPLMLKCLQSKLMEHRFACRIAFDLKAEYIETYSQMHWHVCQVCDVGWNVPHKLHGWCTCVCDHQVSEQQSCGGMLRNCQFKCFLDTQILRHKIEQFATPWDFTLFYF